MYTSVHARLRFVLVLLCLLVATTLPACSATEQGPMGKMRAETAAGLSFRIPENWISQPPTTSMRAAQFALPPAEEGGEASELAVFFFGEGQGGATQANIERWIGQMEQPDGTPSTERAKRTQKKVGQFQVSLVVVDGTLSVASGMMGMTNPHAPDPHASLAKADYRLWAAVVEGAGGPWFFKATGPRAALEQAEPGLEAMIASVKAGARSESPPTE